MSCWNILLERTHIVVAGHGSFLPNTRPPGFLLRTYGSLMSDQSLYPNLDRGNMWRIIHYKSTIHLIIIITFKGLSTLTDVLSSGKDNTWI